MLALPAGQGIKFKKDMENLVAEFKKSLPYVATSEDYCHRMRHIVETYLDQERQSRLIDLNRNVLSMVMELLFDQK